MSIEQLKSVLNAEFVMLPFKFTGLAHDEEVAALEQKLGHALIESFESQKKLDAAKRACTRTEFQAIRSAFLAQFISSDGFDVDAFAKEMGKKRELLKRHLGKDWVYFLSTLVKLHNEIEKLDRRPRGLLGRSA